MHEKKIHIMKPLTNYTTAKLLSNSKAGNSAVDYCSYSSLFAGLDITQCLLLYGIQLPWVFFLKEQKIFNSKMCVVMFA